MPAQILPDREMALRKKNQFLVEVLKEQRKVSAQKLKAAKTEIERMRRAFEQAATAAVQFQNKLEKIRKIVNE